MTDTADAIPFRPSRAASADAIAAFKAASVALAAYDAARATYTAAGREARVALLQRAEARAVYDALAARAAALADAV